jgi:hypothetical protein
VCEDEISIAGLCRIALRAARGKRRGGAVARFLMDIDRQSRSLHEELLSGSYQPGEGRAFWIKDPKPRCIFALPFRDRVVQHLLIERTLPRIERTLAPQSPGP